MTEEITEYKKGWITKMNKPIALTPPMGWNSWNTFTWDINEK